MYAFQDKSISKANVDSKLTSFRRESETNFIEFTFRLQMHDVITETMY